MEEEVKTISDAVQILITLVEKGRLSGIYTFQDNYYAYLALKKLIPSYGETSQPDQQVPPPPSDQQIQPEPQSNEFEMSPITIIPPKITIQENEAN